MIQFRGIKRKNPQIPEDPEKFYPLLKKSGVVDVRTISDELSDASTLNSVDVRAVLFGLEKSLLKYLTDGFIVKFGDLGTFRPSLSGKGAEKETDLTASNVTKIKIVFTPSPILKHAVANATVKKVQET